ncbi:SDR family NAD(P)-dependent oxidoreductase [Persephonella atlantica]|uniref:SDR family NAD(P)-dependent oxidoreductase n=1 Tax=Persephonella atlantica TaxID=2699429 RepID=A0ABS1GFL1_9AQUI|nr:SDR family NAD(P)-dependent oxidoreductase [Persephonella atlantica]MBK3331704.1 SDR family NAD(P)-dependent oxidoreductase [Persephonella atlantica]
MSIKGKNILITGSGRRIGKYLAYSLAKEGGNIVLHYRSSEKEVNQLEEKIKETGANVIKIKADLENIEEIKKLISESIGRFGGIDVLINNASIYYPTKLYEAKEEDLDRFYAVHVKAPFFLSRELGKIMYEKRWGRIINIADYSALRPYRDFTPYSISKGAMLTMTRAFAKELAPYVLVNAVLPGPIIPAEDLEDTDKPLEKTVLKKWGGEIEVYKAVKYLIETEFTTGAFIPVEGGRLIC